MQPILILRNLTKDYPGHRAVDNISLEVDVGAFFSLLGPSGCGKTTTLRMVAGFDQPTAGDILLNGVRVNDSRPYERNVTTVFQNYALFPHLTVEQNIEFGLREQRIPDRRKRVAEALEMVRLSSKAHRRPSQLSGGEKQRVALARSLVLAPAVLLLDEPLAALDPQLRNQMRSELQQMQKRLGIAFLFVTHDREEALSMSTQMAVMHRGRIEQVGSPRDLYFRPSTPFVADFLGTVNWIGGVGVRPEVTRVSRAPVTGTRRSVVATVERTVFLGNCVHVIAKLPSGEQAIAEVAREQDAFGTGDPVHVSWSPSDEMRFAP